MQNEIETYRREIEGDDALGILRWMANRFPGKTVFATSLGIEDQVITDMMCNENIDFPIITLDTGRLFMETYELLAETEKKYNKRIDVFFPERTSVERMVEKHGINLFYDGIEKRKECCRVRKLEALKKALEPYSIWICGLRRDQSITRNNVETIEWDSVHEMIKINPLANWSEARTWAYARDKKIPYNTLHDQGFPSIGCSCCTRAVKPGEDIRSGRWWWEKPEHKECGLHWVEGKLERINIS